MVDNMKRKETIIKKIQSLSACDGETEEQNIERKGYIMALEWVVFGGKKGYPVTPEIYP